MMHSSSVRRMITVKWSLCLIFCLTNSILVSAKHLCLPDQKDSLWGFKNEFNVPSPHSYAMTEKWRNNTDCCSWDGVSCDPKTGVVVELDLQYSHLNGPLRSNSSLFRLQHLQKLVLGSNHLSGILPDSIGNLKRLKVLVLVNCNLFGKIPSSLGNLSYLTHLDLSYNDFTSEGPDSMGNLNRLTDMLLKLSSVTWIDLGDNQLKGINLKISSTVSLPSPIEYLGLLSCNISEFPKFLRNQTSLEYLDISANQIEGQVPEWLWSLPELRYVNISHNSFNGFEGPADVIQGGRELLVLDISSNIFQDPFPLLPVVSMNYLFSSNNRFSGEIPKTICELDNLRILVLSNNNFSGSIPRCFENLHLYVLHLRNNNLSGIFPEEAISHHLQSFDVGHNLFSGELPKSLINCSDIEFLNVEDNRINDTFPSWLELLPNLQILVLRSNEFYGPIFSPGDSLSFSRLRIFDISENRFTGVLPSDYFVGWSVMSSVVDIDGRIIQYTVTGIDRDFYHKSVALINKGLKMELVGSGFTIYKTIDVSGNRLEGDIPESIGLLKEVIVLSMSNNAFTGHIPPSLSNLSNLQSLDLSQNRLSGSIPGELGKLTFLEWMNFSHNRLEGPIPETTQIQTQDSSSFTENPGLCGAPLLKKCGGEEEATKQEQDEDKEEEDQVFSWIAAAIGYVPGVVCGLTIGHILVSHKRDWFMRIVSFFT
ncbi:receptor like protein 47 [Arabidopsis thaliana]|nr:receptor like protein 47 [Arabidopsis thaliana]AEE83328.1 receptor like protein 47 [Arabidopsis thaliana]|eukprot:NP_001190722.1 receptor like protein 47 [Arabidopsis thaliana]